MADADAVSSLWNKIQTFPHHDYVILFCKDENDHRLPKSFLENFFKKFKNESPAWSIQEDPQYETPKLLLEKMFSEEKKKMEKSIQKKKNVNKKSLTEMGTAIEHLSNKLESFPHSSFVILFIKDEIEKSLLINDENNKGLPCSLLQTFVEKFKEDDNWSLEADPEYEVPKKLMETFLSENKKLKNKIRKKENQKTKGKKKIEEEDEDMNEIPEEVIEDAKKQKKKDIEKRKEQQLKATKEERAKRKPEMVTKRRRDFVKNAESRLKNCGLPP